MTNKGRSKGTQGTNKGQAKEEQRKNKGRTKEEKGRTQDKQWTNKRRLTQDNCVTNKYRIATLQLHKTSTRVSSHRQGNQHKINSAPTRNSASCVP